MIHDRNFLFEVDPITQWYIWAVAEFTLLELTVSVYKVCSPAGPHKQLRL